MPNYKLPYDFFMGETPDGGKLETDLLFLLSQLGTKAERGVDIPVYTSDESVAIGDGTLPFLVPLMLDGKELTYAIASVTTKGSANTTDIQIRRVRDGTEADMLSTKITIADDEYYASDGVIDTINDDISTGDLIYIDVDAVGTDAKGLTVTLVFK